jgi:hypothetical protein
MLLPGAWLVRVQLAATASNPVLNSSTTTTTPRHHVRHPTTPILHTSAPRAPAVAAPTSITLPDGSAVARRIIDSDNSCLFNAVGYVMEHTRSKAQELRAVIAAVVAGDPVTYNEGFLGKENEEYCK